MKLNVFKMKGSSKKCFKGPKISEKSSGKSKFRNFLIPFVYINALLILDI